MQLTLEEVAALQLEVSNLKLQLEVAKVNLLPQTEGHVDLSPLAVDIESWRVECNKFMLDTESKLRKRLNNQRREMKRLNALLTKPIDGWQRLHLKKDSK